MRYQGSKAKMAKTVLKDLIEKNLDQNCWYVEPFAGGFNCISEINTKLKIANDINKYSVALWIAIKEDDFINKNKEFISNLTKEQYHDIYLDYKNNGNKYSDAIKGYVGFSCSNSSGWWKGYANFNKKRNENHILEAFNNIKKQSENFINLDSCIINNVSYNELNIPQNSFIYCDPPYESTEGYKVGFDNSKFWEWCREKIKLGNKVMVSEFTAPDDFIEIWSKTMQNGYGTKSQDKIEKIFIHKSQINKFAV